MTVGGPKPDQLVAEQIRVHFEGVKAVDGVDLTLEQGQIMGLIGPNGAGKTTFMNAVSHFVPRTSGRVTLGGRDVTSWPPNRLATSGLVRTFQDVATFPELTVFENVELGALGGGLSRRKARARAWSLLESLGLESMATMQASARSRSTTSASSTPSITDRTGRSWRSLAISIGRSCAIT